MMSTYNLVRSGPGVKIFPQHADLRQDRHHFPSTTIPILFVRQIVHRLWDKERGAYFENQLVAERVRQLLVNHHYFFQIQHESYAHKTISALLDDFVDLGIKKSLHDQVIKGVLRFGRRRKANMNKNKKAFLGVCVSLISIDKFFVDQISSSSVEDESMVMG